MQYLIGDGDSARPSGRPLHRLYISAGSRLLRSTTFCAPSAAAVRAGVNEALAACSGHAEVTVAACFGPQDLREDYFSEAYRAGARLAVCESMMYVEMAERAVRLARECGMACIVSACLACDGNLFSGESATVFARTFRDDPAVAGAGLNCGRSPGDFADAAAEVAEVLADSGKWLYLSPAAGVPDADGVYADNAHDFASALTGMVDAAEAAGMEKVIVCGCCGSTPECISAVRASLSACGVGTCGSW